MITIKRQVFIGDQGLAGPPKTSEAAVLTALAELGCFHLIDKPICEVAAREGDLSLWRDGALGSEIITFAGSPDEMAMLRDFERIYIDDELLLARLRERLGENIPRLLEMRCRIFGPGRIAITLLALAGFTNVDDYTTATIRFSNLRELGAAIELIDQDRKAGGNMTLAELIAPAAKTGTAG